MVEVNEVTHLLGQFAPLGCEHHHVLTTLVVIILSRNILLGSLVVNILLGNAQFLLYAQLNRESVGIPSRLAVNLESLHGLVSVECVLDGTSQHMVNAGMTVC